MKQISAFKAINNEATFGPPIEREVEYGTHITFEVIARKANVYYATEWPSGLPRHNDPPNSMRFPHGLIVFGETVERCVERLVREQLGTTSTDVKVIGIDSYVDDHKHWHLEPLCIAEIGAPPVPPAGAARVLAFTLEDIPALTYWKADELREVLEPYH